jgi:hypothetical protein
MATTAQQAAKRANSQKSTGLHCGPSNSFAQNEAICAQYNELRK